MRRALLAIACTGCTFELTGSRPSDALPVIDADGPVDDAPVDTPAIDVPVTVDAGFDPATQCPGFPISIPSTAATSRYRVRATTASFWTHDTECENTILGATHLVSFDSMAEVIQIASVIATESEVRFYVGGVQDPTAASPEAGWITFHGGAIPNSAWVAGEPQDEDPGENQRQQLLVIDREEPHLRDVTGTLAYAAICECDGESTAALARQFVENDPNNPN